MFWVLVRTRKRKIRPKERHQPIAKAYTPFMSQNNGDKARFDKARQKRGRRRVAMRALRATLEAKAPPKPAAKPQ